ncbi:MAG: D-2-hydroxyacid dehydrogenase [Verrucomicrobia bacterium]|nr:D-2-hydroxyacid dehydrogenase [Verrucomicrobiota bacterium]
MKSPRILLVLSTGLTQEQFDEIKTANPQAELIAATDDTVYENAVGSNALIGCPRKAFTEELLDRVGNDLRWVHSSGAGVEEFLFPRFVESDVTFTNGRVIQGPEVADHALALLLALTRNLHLVLRGDSPRSMPRPVELHGKTVLIFGLGGIGMLIAERVSAFGARVIGVTARNLPPMLPIIDSAFPSEQLEEILPQADAVIVSAPLTPTTKGVFGQRQFGLMKPSAYFVNVSRGGLVNTEELLAALHKGQLRAVGLDVTEPEPLPDDHPLRQLRNVVITPHIAGLSDHNRQRSFELIKTNVARFARGLAPLNPVDKKLGY